MLLEQGVAGRMAERVVVRLEAVEIEQDRGRALAACVRAAPRGRAVSARRLLRPVSGSLTASCRLRANARMFSVNVSASRAITSAIVAPASSSAACRCGGSGRRRRARARRDRTRRHDQRRPADERLALHPARGLAARGRDQDERAGPAEIEPGSRHVGACGRLVQRDRCRRPPRAPCRPRAATRRAPVASPSCRRRRRSAPSIATSPIG